ncbi:tetratricopeptide repeat protein [Salinivibrio socompensis]|uniref:tetratricopeptide repeat protein n=1 Tax=Salinivibrio socompensis TaxID=1510206 RepID=UPI00046F4E48|nr:tetratricopeptide repeat protein [Salinivibrio socompensis]
MLSNVKHRSKQPRCWALVAVCIVGLVGCAGAQPPEKKTLTNEQVLESSGNDREIIGLYKRELKQKESAQTRIKLVKRYLHIKDYDSAGFYLSPLLQKREQDGQPTSEVRLLAGKVAMGLERWQTAVSQLKEVQQRDPNNSESANLLGILAARKGDLVDARQWFNQARMNMADDRTIKNNLALIDVLEENFTGALRRLKPLPELSELSDKTRITLSLIYAKTNQRSAFDVLTPNMDNKERIGLYQQLQALPMADLASLIEVPSEATEKTRPVLSTKVEQQEDAHQ